MRANRFFVILLPIAILVAFGVLALSAGKTFQLKNELASQKVVEEIKAETGKFDTEAGPAIFLNHPIPAPESEILPSKESLELAERQKVLSAAAAEDKWIDVDLGKQRLYAHEGDRIVYEFLISSGKWAPTPTGTFRIWTKLRYAKMSGGSNALHTYYYLPNVPYIMYFYKGYGLHGTYWHNNFGTPMSHGCVNLSIPDAEKLFYWAGPVVPEGKNVVYPSKENPGTLVVVHK